MELQPGDDGGGGASKAETFVETEVIAVSSIDVCGTIATSKGRVGEYVDAGLTAPSCWWFWQQEWLEGIIDDPHSCAIFKQQSCSAFVICHMGTRQAMAGVAAQRTVTTSIAKTPLLLTRIVYCFRARK